MRAVIWVVAVLAALYSGYWFVGARAVEQGAQAGIDAARGRGLTLEHAGLAVAGFPNRFDVTLTAPRFADPQRGLGWSAAFVQVFSLSYKPWHLIAALPNEQVIDLGNDRFTLTTARMTGSLVLEPGTALTLARSAAVAERAALSDGSGMLLSADQARVATRQTVGRDNAHDLAVEITGFAPGSGAQQMLTAAGLAGRVDRFSLSVEAGFDAALNRAALQHPPALTGLDVQEALLHWGDIRAFAAGRLTPDTAGFAEGTLTVRVEGWQAIPPALAAFGLIGQDAVPGVMALLQGMAAQSDGQGIEAPLVFRGGRVAFGFLPLGPAPRLR